MKSIRTFAGPAVVAALLAALTACAPAEQGDAPPAEPGASAAPADPSVAPQGSEAERAAVEAAFRGYYAALLARDFPTACALTAPETRQKLLDDVAARGQGVASCEEALAQIYADPHNVERSDAVASSIEVQQIAVDGDTATVTSTVAIQNQRPVVTNELRLIDGQWRLLDTT